MKPRRQAVLACVILMQACATACPAAETCRFTGTTDYAGHVSVTANAAAAGDAMRIGVTIRFDATTGLWLHLRYLIDEISTWRNGNLLHLDVNTRYVLAGFIVRQQWDDFRPDQKGLEAHRLEGKTAAEFSRQHPRFAQHWDLAAFALPWLEDFAAASPERRADLDLTRAPDAAPVLPPFALAFYWVRFLPPGAQHLHVFLPGFKTGKLADLPLTPVPGPQALLWRALLHHSYLSAAPPSTAAAEISPDNHLQSLTFDIHGPAGSARGHLHQDGCTGSVAP